MLIIKWLAAKPAHACGICAAQAGGDALNDVASFGIRIVACRCSFRALSGRIQGDVRVKFVMSTACAGRSACRAARREMRAPVVEAWQAARKRIRYGYRRRR